MHKNKRSYTVVAASRTHTGPALFRSRHSVASLRLSPRINLERQRVARRGLQQRGHGRIFRAFARSGGCASAQRASQIGGARRKDNVAADADARKRIIAAQRRSESAAKAWGGVKKVVARALTRLQAPAGPERCQDIDH